MQYCNTLRRVIIIPQYKAGVPHFNAMAKTEIRSASLRIRVTLQQTQRRLASPSVKINDTIITCLCCKELATFTECHTKNITFNIITCSFDISNTFTEVP